MMMVLVRNCRENKKKVIHSRNMTFVRGFTASLLFTAYSKISYKGVIT